MIQTVLNDENETNQWIYVFPTSAILEDRREIGYFDYISALKNGNCSKALERMAGRIDTQLKVGFPEKKYHAA